MTTGTSKVRPIDVIPALTFKVPVGGTQLAPTNKGGLVEAKLYSLPVTLTFALPCVISMRLSPWPRSTNLGVIFGVLFDAVTSMSVSRK